MVLKKGKVERMYLINKIHFEKVLWRTEIVIQNTRFQASRRIKNNIRKYFIYWKKSTIYRIMTEDQARK